MKYAIILSITLTFVAQAIWATPSELYTPADGEPQTGLFVHSKLGLTDSISEINKVVAEAQASKVLTKIEAAEYNRRVAEAKSVLDEAKASGNKLTFDELQTVAKNVAAIADALNNKLSPIMPNYAVTDKELETDYKQLRDRIAQRLRDGRIDPLQAKRIRIEAKRVYETALADKSTDTIEDASRSLHKLGTQLQTQSAYRFKPSLGGSFLDYPRVF